MPNVFFDTAKTEILNQTLAVRTDALIKMMLLANAVAYVPSPADDVVDQGIALDAAHAEANVTGYVRGFGGAGRKTLANRTVTVDKTNHWALFDFDDVSYGALGNGTNQTLNGAMLIKEGATNDTASRQIAYFTFANFVTNGAAFTLQIDPAGAVHLAMLAGAFARVSWRRIWSWLSERLTAEQVGALRLYGIEPHVYRKVRA
jgi:hypothetical protein